MKDSRLFEIKIDFTGHSVYSLDGASGLPKTERCDIKNHSDCRVGDYVKGEIKEIYKNKIKVEDYEIGEFSDGGSIKVLILVPASYNKKKLQDDIKETFRECDNVFHLGGKNDLVEISVRQKPLNYSLSHKPGKYQDA